MGRMIGIDLGTTNSCVAVLESGEPQVIHNQEGGRTTPSMVSWNADGDVVVGAASKRQMVTNPTRTVFGVKRLIGRKVADPEIQRLTRTLPYTIAAAKNGDAWVSIDGQAHSAQEISAHVVAKMRRVAEDYLGEQVTEAVITVPAYFDDVQRQATKDAGAIAGLQVRAILNEPTAAALAYGVQHQHDQRVAVFDLGGGTFDISILTIENAIIELLAEHFQAESGVDPRGDAVSLQRLKEAAEQAKIELSSTMTTDVNLPFLAIGKAGPVHLTRSLSRGEVERACRDLLARLAAPCAKALELARCTSADIDQVLLVGGMSRMPAVQEAVLEIFGKPAHKGVNPDESVAVGAAIHSAVIGGELQEVVLLDVTPHDLGVKVAGDKLAVIIPANTSIPTRETKVFATTEDNQTFVAVEVYQGPHAQASRNRRLGRFVLGDLRAAPRGATRVEVSFTMDADGILHVEAVEIATGKLTSVTIEAASGLSNDEIKRLAAGMR
jgi:molecular chaperone DnaK